MHSPTRSYRTSLQSLRRLTRISKRLAVANANVMIVTAMTLTHPEVLGLAVRGINVKDNTARTLFSDYPNPDLNETINSLLDKNNIRKY